MRKSFSIALANVQGSATFSGKPNKKQIAAVNHLAETAYKELSKLPKTENNGSSKRNSGNRKK